MGIRSVALNVFHTLSAFSEFSCSVALADLAVSNSAFHTLSAFSDLSCCPSNPSATSLFVPITGRLTPKDPSFQIGVYLSRNLQARLSTGSANE
jgi:hypothetical protein